jgi:putative tryptophan/tyrosine transport system substrate-binding protein
MRRREFSTLHPTTISPDQPLLISLWRQALGYVEGETVLLRSADGALTRLPALVGELLGLDVGVLIMVGAPTVKASRRATAATPIVAIDLESDPVLAGYAASVARPGGNVTGLFMDMSSLAGGVVAVP